MVIGHSIIKRFASEDIVFESDITGFSQTGGRIFIDIVSGYQPSLPLSRSNIYSITITIEDTVIRMNASFQDYIFNAGASDYIDGEGVHHTGIVTLSNRLQFGIVG